MVTQAFELPGYHIVQNLGVVRGLTVRSRSVFGSIGGSFQTLWGGKITIFAKLCEDSREEAFHLLIRHAEDMGANAIIGMRYDATEIFQGVTEVLAYGTAVLVQKNSQDEQKRLDDN